MFEGARGANISIFPSARVSCSREGACAALVAPAPGMVARWHMAWWPGLPQSGSRQPAMAADGEKRRQPRDETCMNAAPEMNFSAEFYTVGLSPLIL